MSKKYIKEQKKCGPSLNFFDLPEGLFEAVILG
jgi:hypothetical protein